MMEGGLGIQTNEHPPSSNMGFDNPQISNCPQDHMTRIKPYHYYDSDFERLALGLNYLGTIIVSDTVSLLIPVLQYPLWLPVR
jgi:hypothetical protein